MIDIVYNTATFNENNPDESVVIEDQNMEELARILLSCKELREEFANQVRTLTSQGKKLLADYKMMTDRVHIDLVKRALI